MHKVYLHRFLALDKPTRKFISKDSVLKDFDNKILLKQGLGFR